MNPETERSIGQTMVARWPGSMGGDIRVIGTKLAEEAGEVCGALVKLAEGRRTRQDVVDEMGDVLIVLSVLAHQLAPDLVLSLEDIRHARWLEVKDR